MIKNIVEYLKKILVILLILVLANLLSSFFWGFLLTMGGNIEVIGFNSISFDPLITIAYMILFYFLSIFYQPVPKAQFYLFLFTLFLSFTVNFIQGSIYLVLIYIFLRQFRII
ncbi:MAG: hypothetical protein QHH09_02505 [Microgenomates group bacterium]|jgi:hypothetical protein|nr:hypothetical protein [Microgenomates group bacterium]